MLIRLLHGDCMERLAALPTASLTTICCDPPYGLEFMGKGWDKLDTANYATIQKGNNSPHARRHSVNYLGSPNPTCRNCGGLRSLATEGSGGRKKCRCEDPDFPNYRTPAMQAQQRWHQEWLAEVFRVLAPGGVIKAFGGTRVFHRLAAAMAGVGFEDIGITAWAYGSGFPKSHNVAVYMDRMLTEGRSRTIVRHGVGNLNGRFADAGKGFVSQSKAHRVTTPEATPWIGWGTALKPAWEPVLVGRKP
jgi:site-specific DNA-methyltransferase (adenine-specific)